MLNQYLLRYSLVLLVSLLSIAALSQNLRIYPVMDSDPKDFGGRVNCIFQDRIGFIWIGKETGLFRYDGNEMRSFRYDPADPQSIGANNILTIIEDTIGNLWIGNKGGGLNHYNRASGRFTRYQHDEHNPESISYNEVYVVKPDGKGNFWIGTDGGGLNFFDPRTGKFQSIKQSPGDPTGTLNIKGLIQSDHTLRAIRPKVAFYSIQNVASVFDHQLERIKDFRYSTNSTELLSVFGYRNKASQLQMVNFWLNSGTPNNHFDTKTIEITVENGNFKKPVWVDLYSGRIYEIPKSNWNKNGSTYKFNVPVYDSPVLIADLELIEK